MLDMTGPQPFSWVSGGPNRELVPQSRGCRWLRSCCNLALPASMASQPVLAHPPARHAEYCARGSLLDVLQAARASPQQAALLTWPLRLQMALNAAAGIQ